ncbi:MAG: 4-hydroxy-tetrahydrodipicolinate reductase [Alphaproteobacteria bacterium]|nr:4-hydroxy-tetrahydrodipicolinate reductase [Alphaproteobacteria bacterium]
MNITITGAGGRMGQMLLRAVINHPEATLFGATLRPENALIDKDVSTLIGGTNIGITLSGEPLKIIPDSDVVIDFTLPDAAINHVRICANSETAYVCGTTGFSEKQSRELDMCGHYIPVLRAANFSLGVNLLLGMVKQAAQILPDDYDIEITEMHHRQKLDAPSGTALALGEACALGKIGADNTQNLADMMLPPHDGLSTSERAKGKIGYATLRGGTVVGEHQVIFAGTDERIIFDHRAQSKEIFAKGAVHGALWLGKQKAGLYSMLDVLNLASTS